VVANVALFNVSSGIVSEDRETALHPSDVLWRVIDQKVDVFGEPTCAMSQNGEAPDQDIPRASVVQRSADADEVFRLWRSCVVNSILVIHASASSKLMKR
jgi:hypothetical protein